MREIKFRGIRTAKGKMTYGDLHYHVVFGLPFINGNEVYSATVGQYTGLKDKNGVEIYEGDILGREGHWSHYVGFKDASFVIIPCNPIQRVNWIWYPVKRYVVEDWKIIGNIHENPELLENTEQLGG